MVIPSCCSAHEVAGLASQIYREAITANLIRISPIRVRSYPGQILISGG